MLVAPSEPKTIKILGRTSSLPEKRGADIMFPAAGGLVGIQRKEISDLIASLHDGRLAKELAQMQTGLSLAVLIVEGRLKWTADGALMKEYGAPYTRTAHRNLLRSVQSRGVWVEATDDASDTVVTVLELQAWVSKPSHAGLLTRPGPTSPWGKADNRDWSIHLLQSFDGIGPETAKNILDTVGMPLAWKVTAEDLVKVPGVGPKTASKLIGALA